MPPPLQILTPADLNCGETSLHDLNCDPAHFFRDRWFFGESFRGPRIRQFTLPERPPHGRFLLRWEISLDQRIEKTDWFDGQWLSLLDFVPSSIIKAREYDYLN
ncbi:MAG: hypothetical protein ACR2OZ_16370 [Verrucomicrobiales bacterium]